VALEPFGLLSGLLAGTAGEGSLAAWVSAIFGSGLVAFVIAAGNATLLLVANTVRFKLGGLGLGIDTQRRAASFPVTLACHSFFDGCPARPRAPPT
jgi:hypothetical protein